MIKVEFCQNDQKEITYLKVSGHSGYDEIGKDIVCSAVSTAMYVTIGILQKSNSEINFFGDEENTVMKIEILNTNSYTNIAMDNLIEFFEAISIDYAEFIQIIKK